MSKREILAGATDQTIDVFIQDTTSITGKGLTGLVFNASGLTCYYRKGATGTATALTLATQTVGGAHSDGGFVLIDDTNCPGLYRLDLSDTMVSAAGMLTIYLRGAANMVPCVMEIEVVAVNKFDAVRMGLTAIPNVVSGSSGGLIVQGTGTTGLDVTSGKVDVGKWTGTAVATPDTAGHPVVTIKEGTGAGELDFTSGIVKADLQTVKGSNITESSGGQLAMAFTKFFDVASATGTVNSLPDAVPGASGGVFIAGTNAATSITTALTANIIGNITGNLSGSAGSVTGAVGSVTGNVGGNVAGSVASVTAGVTLADDAITAAKFDESTAFPITAANGSQFTEAGGTGDQLTSVALAATGLDSITATAPGGVASTFPEMMVQLWRRFFKKSTLTATTLVTYADDGSTAETTQTVSDDGTTETQGAAS